MKTRCAWVGNDAVYQKYHDEVWGVPERDDKALFAKLILDGMQAGLSWITILKKQEAYFELFAGLDPDKLIHFTDTQLEEILLNPAIIRNRLKVFSIRKNAIAYFKVLEDYKTFSEFLWQFTNGKTKVNKHKTIKEVPAISPESDAMSKALKKYGFSFVGSTICYAFMQAVGMVNDHTVDCFRYKEVL
ncbi:MAG: DNA-3-methyladenine glycosylase I [Chitinophagales bacterium]|nr:DNA-3-methyladenine glycosylase I [Chitinophagales bacterium]